MRSGPLPWRCAEWKGPHKQDYVMRENSQHKVGVPIFNSEFQKYIFVKLTVHLAPPLYLPLFHRASYNSTQASPVSFTAFKDILGAVLSPHASLPGLNWYSFDQLLFSLGDQQYFQKP